MIRKAMIVVCVLLVGMFVACNTLLPERFAVNAPVLSMLFGRMGPPPTPEVIDQRFRVPKGFGLSLFSSGHDNIRWIHSTEAGDFVVSRSRAGEILLVKRDGNGDGRSDGSEILLSELNQPQGIELADGWLYIAETDAIGRIRFDATTRSTSGDFERIVTGIPGGGNHRTRTIAFGPDGLLYLSIGSSCNVCEESDPRRASMLRYQPDGSGGEVVATGLRNAVGFDWQPGTNALYATDNGRDLLGDNFPPCELNKVELGGFYGWPVANGNRVPDPDFGEGQEERIRESIPPAFDFPAHNAPLGIHFVRGDRIPEALRGAAIVALHGSWNRTRKDGYKVVSLTWAPDGTIEQSDFVTGFEVDGDVVGRPVHVTEGSDGAFYITDDFAGSIWRVAYGEKSAAIETSPAAPVKDPLTDLPESTRDQLAESGAALYSKHQCGTCHEADMAPPGVATKPLANLAARFDLLRLEALFTTPPPPMPIYPLSDDEKHALAVYLFSRTGSQAD